MFWLTPNFWDFVLLLTPFYLFGLIDYYQWRFTDKYADKRTEHRWYPSFYAASPIPVFMSLTKWGIQIIWILLMLLPLPRSFGVG